MDMNAHDLPLLMSLSTMLDERNITRAAARLGVSQPALSAQLARLRDIFGDQLLTPAVSGKGMVLTPRAAALREPLRQALQNLGDVVSEPASFDPAATDRTFSIGANDNVTAMIGARLVSTIRDNGRSKIRVAFRGVNPAHLMDQLESGEIDVALVSQRALPKGFPSQLLLEEDFMMAQRKSHPRGTKRPSLREYAKLDHVIVSGDGGGFRGFVDDILEEKGVTRRVALSVQFYSVVPDILASTDLVCTLPDRFLNRYRNSLTILRLPFETARFGLHATWHPRFKHDSGHAWFLQQLSACVADNK